MKSIEIKNLIDLEIERLMAIKVSELDLETARERAETIKTLIEARSELWKRD